MLACRLGWLVCVCVSTATSLIQPHQHVASRPIRIFEMHIRRRRLPMPMKGAWQCAVKGTAVDGSHSTHNIQFECQSHTSVAEIDLQHQCRFGKAIEHGTNAHLTNHTDKRREYNVYHNTNSNLPFLSRISFGIVLESRMVCMKLSPFAVLFAANNAVAYSVCDS